MIRRGVAILGALLGACSASPQVAPGSAAPSAAVPWTVCDSGPKAPSNANYDEELSAVDVQASLAMYEEAVVQDPTDPELLWKLGLAYESQERWDAAATTFQRAAALSPEVARYWYRGGRAWLKQGAAGDAEAYDAARELFEKCVETTPGFGECYYFLGETEEASDREQEASEWFRKALEHEPKRARNYLRLAELYGSFRRYAEAEQVLREGVRLVPALEANAAERCRIYVELSHLARRRQDAGAELSALAAAVPLADAAEPELVFELGRSYALPEPPAALDAARRQRAVELLQRLSQGVCRSARAVDYREQCEGASFLLQRLGS